MAMPSVHVSLEPRLACHLANIGKMAAHIDLHDAQMQQQFVTASRFHCTKHKAACVESC